jgi:hypothetical protein
MAGAGVGLDGAWIRRPLRRDARGPFGLEARVGVGRTGSGRAALKVVPSAGAGRSESESMKGSVLLLLLLSCLKVLDLRWVELAVATSACEDVVGDEG